MRVRVHGALARNRRCSESPGSPAFLGLALGALTVLSLAGCDDGEDDCDGVADRCETEGAQACGLAGVRECRADADRCLVWVEARACTDNARCVAEDGVARCECEHACEGGQSQCSGAVVEACRTDGDGCRFWVAETDCDDSGRSCDASSGTAECVGGCESDCARAGDERCTAIGTIETCTETGASCLRWRETGDCAASGQSCEETGAGAACVDECVADCETVDATRCSADGDVEVCADQGEGCLRFQLDDDCDDATEHCDDAAVPAFCAPDCVSDCETVDATRCSADDDVEVCADLGGGCLQWRLETDCDVATEHCDDAAAPATCAALCLSDCTAAGELRCGPVTGGVEACTEVGAGCLRYVLATDCAALGRACDDSGADPVCGALVGGDSCADPMVVTTFPFSMAGTDISADFTNAVDLSGAGCTLRIGSVEAVFQVDLLAGQGVLVRELGPLDAVLGLQRTCGSGECVFSEDLGETTGHRHRATVDETVYVIVEAWSASSASAYEIAIDLWTDEVCDDGLDNDLDGEVDCDDGDCFGFAPSCLTELNCGDGADNDGDTLVDCADPDCATARACGPRINEIAYDDAGIDDHEFVELAGPAGYALTGFTLVHVNGSGGADIWAVDLGAYSLDARGFLVIGPSADPTSNVTWTDLGRPETDAIQNGPDALVLVYDRGGAGETYHDAVAYEGLGALPVWAYETDASVGLGHGNWNSSIGRSPDGTDTDVNSADVVPLWWTTPGAPNTPASPEGFTRYTGSGDAGLAFPIDIPDATPAGVTLTMDLSAASWFPATIADLHVGVRIGHTWRGDLGVTLTSPDGTAVVLHDRSGGSADDLMTVYDLATPVADATLTMDDFAGETGRGLWTLVVVDAAGGDVGQVLEWVLWATAP